MYKRQDIGHSNIKVVFDTGNRIAFGHDLSHDIEILGDKITHIHIKDKNINNENVIYSAIKGGIINQTKQMAAYYGQFGIRINSISPGGIKGKIAGKRNSQSNKFIKRYSARTPLKRMGDPSDIAPAVIFLSSSASNYITGSNIVIDGGWTVI